MRMDSTQNPLFTGPDPPADTNYDFYLFDYQNPDEITIFGQTPSVVEKGPYRWKEQDQKGSVEFGPGNKDINYETSKTYVFDEENSGGKYDDKIVLPNLSMATMSRLLFENYPILNDTQRTLANLTTLFLGVYPFTQVTMNEIIYVGYTDGLLDFLNSDFQKQLKNAFGNILGFDPPDIKLLGFFAGYNHTADGNYTAHTGQADYKKVGLIQKWQNSSTLDFWKSKDANDLSETTDGALSGSYLEKTDLNLFQSFLCRKFKLNYVEEETIEGISSYKYAFDPDNYNPYNSKFSGYLYDNDEQINYFPNWTLNSTDTTHNEFPPGFIQQKCIPGKLDRLPFVAFGSQPHFLNSPEQVQKSIIGLSPNKELHDMGEFNIQPTLGSALQANVRTQLNIAMHQTDHITSLSHSIAAILPAFWLHTSVKLHPYAYKFIRTSTVTVPKIAMFAGIGIGVAALLCIVLLIVLLVVSRRKEASARL
ncbi:hypothetical protein M3Y97_00255400 [Aphelenchoides bicaudatus]|nr:hypothetical protein M3Y97_00255400 [Aphelenchoides bicaudatus]